MTLAALLARLVGPLNPTEVVAVVNPETANRLSSRDGAVVTVRPDDWPRFGLSDRVGGIAAEVDQTVLMDSESKPQWRVPNDFLGITNRRDFDRDRNRFVTLVWLASVPDVFVALASEEGQ